MDIIPVHCSLRLLNPDNRKDVAEAAKMHFELLGWGEIAGLGQLFLEHFCYRTLVKDGLMKVSLYEVDGIPVGFIAYTTDSLNFHRKAMRKHFLYIFLLIAFSIIKKPSLIFNLPRAVRLIRSRRQEIGHPKKATAEILAIAVRPEYRTLAFNKRTSLRISEALFYSAVSYCREAGMAHLDVFVDAFNTEALLFYQSLGGILKPCHRAGVDVYHVTFDLDFLHF
ncbi:MAG: hypothetical protein QHH14_11865 [Clostridiales bacterium]|nr:hypothetical protein [Clostridiales bacterium]